MKVMNEGKKEDEEWKIKLDLLVHHKIQYRCMI